MVQLGASYAHVARILNCTKLRITRWYSVTGWLGGLQTDHEVEDPASQQPTRTAISASYTYVTDSSLWRHLQRLALDMASVVTLYVVDYNSMVSGRIDHSEFDVYGGHISFNVGNIGTGFVFSFLLRAGSCYSELMAGLGYTDVQEIELLRAVFRRLYHLVVDLWWFGAVSVANSRQTLLSLMEILPHTVTCICYWNMLFVVNFICLCY